MATRAAPRRRDPPRRGRSDLGARLVVAVPALAVVLYLTYAGGLPFTLLLVALGLVCLHELCHMFERSGPPKLAVFAGLIGILLAAHHGDREHVLLALVAAVPLLFAVSAAMPRATAYGLAVGVLGLVWVGVALAHAIELGQLDEGEKIIVAILAGTFAGDTGAYFGGRSLGTRKLAPEISPNKTVEGLAIGMLTAVLAVWVAGLYIEAMSGVQSLILGGAIAVAAPVGDLFESFLKREAGTKDTGRAFGAHGGALDRVDAVLFTAVVGYYVWLAMLS
jgi:phosphatidate cytidylyltransferase